MDNGVQRHGKKRLPSWIRWPLVGAGAILAVPLTILGSMVLFNLLRPVELPPSLRRVITSISSDQPLHGERRTPATADAVTSPTASHLADRLIPASAVHDANQRALADELNSRVMRIRADMEHYQREKADWMRGHDPDGALGPELMRQQSALISGYVEVKRRLGTGFDRALQRRWHDAFLGMLIEKKDWWLAVEFSSNEPDFGNWQATVYCCQQMEWYNGAVVLGGVCAENAVRWLHGTFKRADTTADLR
jgi:hypothetical protein